MTKQQQLIHEELVNDLRVATAAADAKRNAPDDGTFNLDHVIIRYGRKGIQYARALKEAGIAYSKDYWLGACFSLRVGEGDAARNTVMVEAFAGSLPRKRWPVSIYYRKD